MTDQLEMPGVDVPQTDSQRAVAEKERKRREDGEKVNPDETKEGA